ncbi:hypothetical protein [Donghicola sp.]|jgi:hypothetical protein|uniref:hypothetical protein n=1 Tax=Donghicola sp. TaxID=1929294 RepID=UPI0025D884BE|nr:hypothetical protein [Donghicola sp.]MCT4576849.1 hypothetical protein [Donghicola sp.]
MKLDDLITLANMLSKHRELSLSTVSVYAANDGKFFNRLQEGGSCTFRTAARLMNWFSENWPSDLDWPEGIERPSAAKKAAA